jgi:hypothetical protein
MAEDPKTLQEKVSDLHEAFIDNLIRRIKSGEATSADMALAWKVCVDNGVELADLAKLKREDPLVDELPFTDEGDPT